jgi:hypothetical protein
VNANRISNARPTARTLLSAVFSISSKKCLLF